MRRRIPLGNRKWREVTDFDLKVLSTIIIVLSIVSVSLLLYATYLRIQKSKVDAVVKEVPPSVTPEEERVVRTATQTIVYVKPPVVDEPTPVVIERGAEPATHQKLQSAAGEKSGNASDEKVRIVLGGGEEGRASEQNVAAEAGTPVRVATEVMTEAPSANLETQAPEKPAEEPAEEPAGEPEEVNKYLKDTTKFDFSFLLSRMSEVLPSTKLYLYVVDGDTALRLAKRTENYVIDVSGKMYHVAVPRNLLPHLEPTVGIYTVRADPVKNSKDVFKSIVNLRAFGMSAFSVKVGDGYALCIGVFKTEAQARNFYYSQDWVELAKFANVSGAKVMKIGE